MNDFAGYQEIKARHTNGEIIYRDPIEPLAPFDPTALDGVPVPVRPWLVPGWIPMARATALYGAGGEGKTSDVPGNSPCA